jgi:uncharacterized protein
MKKITFHLLAGLLLVLISFATVTAQKTKKAPAKKASATEKTAIDNSLLWEISGKGLAQKSYLFGTMHMLCPGDLVVSDKIKNAMQSSQQLVLELDLSNPNIMAEMQASAIMQDGTTAKDYLSAEDYQIVERFFKDSLNMPLEQVGIVKPFFLSSFTMMKYLNCQPVAWETTLMNMAKENDLTIGGLETVQQQIAAIEKTSLQKQGKMLAESIRDYEKSKKMMEEMVALYKQEDIATMYTVTKKYMTDEYADSEKALLQERNKNWIKSIEEGIKAQSSFYAVGAAHLGGPEGVIALLKKQGYTVKAVK